ncbi:EutP/PduV family microcompartment system protein [Desulfotalea psychrophila]|uniref:EutP/PduV family microcompartment system protein n=1 Tax=Desulfotalea psychrophila TaxID=84980 RepID=UPI0018E0794E
MQVAGAVSFHPSCLDVQPQGVGLITKIDSPHANVERAKLFLKNAGIKETLCCSSITGAGLEEIRQLIQ